MYQKCTSSGFSFVLSKQRKNWQVYHYYSKYGCCCFYYSLLLLPKRSLISSGNNQATTVPHPGQGQLCFPLLPSSAALASTTSNLCSTSLTRSHHKGAISRSWALQSNCGASASLVFFFSGQMQSGIVLAPKIESRARQQPKHSWPGPALGAGLVPNSMSCTFCGGILRKNESLDTKCACLSQLKQFW